MPHAPYNDRAAAILRRKAQGLLALDEALAELADCDCAAVLARLVAGSREEEKAAAKAAVDAQQARLARMTKGYRTEEKEQARNELQAVEAEVQNALAELNRERGLLASKSSTVAQYDAAFSRWRCRATKSLTRRRTGRLLPSL